jgi:hypothetical protein
MRLSTGPSKDWVAFAVAVSIGTAINMFTFAVLYDAIFSRGSGLSSNATQVLTGWGGGLIGILGAYIGYRASGAGAGDTTAGVDTQPSELAGRHIDE